MFQGQEKMVIIISMVRNTLQKGDKKLYLDFLTAKEHTNVALSRAKSLLIIIGNPLTMISDHQWKTILLQAIKKNNYIGCNVPKLGYIRKVQK